MPLFLHSDKLSQKTSLFIKSEILELFVNTLTASDKYSLHNRENVPEAIQMHLSPNSKTFCQYFIAFLEST